MKICCVSDLHGHLPEIPDCDLLLLGGDLVPRWAHEPLIGRSWLDTNFRRWLDGLTSRCRVVGVAGNHDFVFEAGMGDLARPLPWTYLQDSDYTVGGLKVYGSPWQPYFGGWAFNLEEDDLAARWEMVPGDADILLLHGPPYLHGDLTPEGLHVGSPSLLRSIRRVRPRLVVCGHIHSARGVYEVGVTTIVNASLVDEAYRPIHEPFLVEIDGDEAEVLRV